MKLKGVIFDMDGLLVDSEPFWRQAECEVFRTVGLELTDAQCQQTTGMRIDDVVRYWHERESWDLGDRSLEEHQEELSDAIVKRVAALVETQAKALPGVAQGLDLFDSLGFRIALATSSHPRIINAVFRALERNEDVDCETLFEVATSAVHEKNGKPAPDVYLRATELLGIPVERCLAFEDSPTGVESALGAGLITVAIPREDYGNDERLLKAHRVISSLDEVNEFWLDGL